MTKFNSLIIGMIMALFFASTVCALEQEPFQEGETITYEIRKMGLTIGEAIFEYNGPTQIDGQNAVLVTFTTKALNFFDEEKIYMNPKTMYPMMVTRDLNLWGKKEQIKEVYALEQGTVKVAKTVKGKTTEQIIEKENILDNIYCFIYRYRNGGNFQKGDKLELNLPTRDVMIRLLGETDIKAGDKQYDAFYMESDSKKYKIWFGRGPHKIPLRIDGSLGFGKTSLIMKDYQNRSDVR